jgi:hypothetical protein
VDTHQHAILLVDDGLEMYWCLCVARLLHLHHEIPEIATGVACFIGNEAAANEAAAKDHEMHLLHTTHISFVTTGWQMKAFSVTALLRSFLFTFPSAVLMK